MRKKLLLTVALLLAATASFARLDRIAQRIVSTSYELQTAVGNYEHGNGGRFEVKNKIDEMQRMLEELERGLNGHNPRPDRITGNCSLSNGGHGRPGDHRRREKEITCTISGVGATGYEIVSSDGQTYTGYLNSTLMGQTFSTRVRNGRRPGTDSYTVYVTTLRGSKIQITTLN